MYAIIIKNLSKKYGTIQALHDVSLSIQEGEIFGLLGPNGAGKTTLIKILATLLRPSAGNVQVFSFDVESESFEVRKQLGYSPQDIALDKFQTGRQILRMIGVFYHLHGKELEISVKTALDIVNLTKEADIKTRKYSGGMKKRLEIASALLHQPQILVLDEPTLGLDIETRYEVWNYLKKINKLGTTVLLTTHYLEEAEQLCHRIAIIDHGFLKVVGNPETLRDSIGNSLLKIKINPTVYNDFQMKSHLIHDIINLVSKELSLAEAVYDNFNQTLVITSSNPLSDLTNLLTVFNEQKLRKIIESISLSKPSLSDVYLSYIQSKHEKNHKTNPNSIKDINNIEVLNYD